MHCYRNWLIQMSVTLVAKKWSFCLFELTEEVKSDQEPLLFVACFLTFYSCLILFFTCFCERNTVQLKTIHLHTQGPFDKVRSFILCIVPSWVTRSKLDPQQYPALDYLIHIVLFRRNTSLSFKTNKYR